MNLTSSSIVEGINEQTSIVNKVCPDDWTGEMLTIANVNQCQPDLNIYPCYNVA